MCQLAESSIKKVLDENGNAAHLLELHKPAHIDAFAEKNIGHTSSARFIRIK